MAVLNKIGSILEKISSAVVIVLTAVMCLVILAQVIMRYFFNSPLTWSEELARYTMIWVTFLGTAVAQKRGTLVCVDMFVERVPERVQRIFRIACDIISLLFSGIMTWYSILFATSQSALLQKSPAMHIPMCYVYMCVPIGFGMMFYHILLKVLNQKFGEKGAEI